MAWTDVLLVFAGYLVGMFPTAILVGQRTGHDPSLEGSTNPGATNVYRLSGRSAGAMVLLGDLLKAVAAAGVGLILGGRGLGLAMGVAAVLGHMFPASRRFRGGKGVASGAGMSCVLFPWVALALGAVFAVTVTVTRRASVASLTIAVLLPIGVAAAGRPAFEVATMAILSLVVIARHHENIRRLLSGSESVTNPGDSP